MSVLGIVAAVVVTAGGDYEADRLSLVSGWSCVKLSFEFALFATICAFDGKLVGGVWAEVG